MQFHGTQRRRNDASERWEVILYATGDAPRRPSPWESTISIGNYNGNLRPEFISDPPQVANPSERNPRYNDGPRRRRCLRRVRKKERSVLNRDYCRLPFDVNSSRDSKRERAFRRNCNFSSLFLDSLVCSSP